MKNSFLYDRIKDISVRGSISFHVPGHKYGRMLKEYNNNYFSTDMFLLDTTELPETDNLHSPSGIIKKAQEKAAKIFNADHTFFIINGTSSGNIAALMTVLNPGDKIIIPRDCHKSIMHGLIMGDYIPVYISPEINYEWGIPAGINPKNIEKAILDNPEVKAVVITYPNYYGICSDIHAIVEVVKKYDKILIVDEAHGSHFILSDRLPISSIMAGADITIQSTHKTLPALTQASMLHLKSNKVNIDRLKSLLMMIQSSSPSYLLMSSLDAVTDIVEKHGHKMMENLLKKLTYLESEVEKIPGVKIMNNKVVGINGIWDKDKTRIVLNMTRLGISGIELSELLRIKYDIQMEMADFNNVVGVTSIGNNINDIECLIGAIKEISKGKEYNKYTDRAISFSYPIPDIKITPRNAFFSEKRLITFEKALGKVSGEYIIPYPPGIPILCPGEVITEEILRYISLLLESHVDIIGTHNKNLENLTIIE